MEDEKVRLGFVGTGRMGQCAHLRNYVALSSECEVAALAELRSNTGTAVAQRFGIGKVYADAEEMLTAEELDGIVASQMFCRHETLLKQILKYGLPVFIEKPLADCVETGERILSMIGQYNARVMVGYHKRSDPATAYAKSAVDRFIKSGELGRMKYVRITMPIGEWICGGFDLLVAEVDEEVRLARDPKPSSLGPERYSRLFGFVNYYIHQINLLRLLLGESYRVTHADPAGVLLVGRGTSGIPCLIEMNPYSTSLAWEESALTSFEHGYVRLDLPAPMALNRPGRVEILHDPANGATPRTIIPHLPWVHAMKEQAMRFIRFVRGTAQPPCGPEEALEDLRVAQSYLDLFDEQHA